MLGRIGLRVSAFAVLGFLYLPLLFVLLYAFNDSRRQSWPIETVSLRWFAAAAANEKVRDAFALSVQAGFAATVIALVLGTLIAFAVQRYAFFGRETISFLVVLPLALPGIVTGMALNATINEGIQTIGFPHFGLFTIVAGHATFCVVVVYNNVIARLRRTPRTQEEASMDLGADAGQTFRHVTLPAIATALFAGALLAFALSFDEIIVTTFTAGTDETLPIWIFSNFRLPNQRPVVNVVALVMVVLSAVPVYLSARLSGASGQLTSR
jgi:putative spermidine/putrescine transport system permease protein